MNKIKIFGYEFTKKYSAFNDFILTKNKEYYPDQELYLIFKYEYEIDSEKYRIFKVKYLFPYVDRSKKFPCLAIRFYKDSFYKDSNLESFDFVRRSVVLIHHDKQVLKDKMIKLIEYERYLS